MKRFTGILVFISLILVVFSCSTGYTSIDGTDLDKYLSPESLQVLTQNPDSTIWIIDVRPESAYNNGHIPTAKSFPSRDVLNRLNELPKSQNLIFYCETGGRAQMVINNLEDEGYTRMFNWGGYTRWLYDLVTEE